MDKSVGLAIGTAAAAASGIAAVLFAAQRQHGAGHHWTRTLDEVLPAIVVINMNYVRPFDGEVAGSAVATGFIVDAQRGIILTNRHVVSTGPMRATATFTNKEEVDLVPIYRDPVHDFGFFSFSPAAVKYMKVVAIELAPNAARVGLEIRVVGNDNGEKLSILSGTLARLDRNAPHYDHHTYNDFNTFYYAAASNTSGGSSGSPVLDCKGRAVALNAGGSFSAASSFYLPLQRPLRALQCLQARQTIPRGTLRVVWTHSTYDELAKLGLRETTEQHMRMHPDGDHPQRSGLLVVEQLIQGSHDKDVTTRSRASDDHGSGTQTINKGRRLDVGDVLLAIDGVSVTCFVALAECLDNDVGNCVAVTVERSGKELIVSGLLVEDLHALTPAEFVECSGAVLHPISFMQARNGNLKIGSGLYVASAGFSFDAAGVKEHSIVARVGTTRTTSLQEFQKAMAAVADGNTVVVRFYNIGDRHNVQVVSVRVNHRWFPMKQWHRNDTTGLWDSINYNDTLASRSESQGLALQSDDGNQEISVKLLPVQEIAAPVGLTLNLSAAANRVIPSLCKVTFNVLHAIDGVHEWHFTGCGLVVCAKRGLVLVDRNTITIGLGEVTVSFAASVEVPARIVFMHPFHNFALVQYDPRNFETGTIQSAVLGGDCSNGDAIGLKPGDSLEFVGLCRSNTDTCMSQAVRVSEISCVAIPQASTPRFRAANEDIVKFEEAISKNIGGIFIDASSRVRAIWASYSYYSWSTEKNHESFHGLPVSLVTSVLPHVFSKCPVIHAIAITPIDDSSHSEGHSKCSNSSEHAHGELQETYAIVPRPDESEILPRSLDVGLKRLPLSVAVTSMGLPSKWVDAFVAVNDRSQVLAINELLHGAPSSGHFEAGDLLLAVDGHTVCAFQEVEQHEGSKRVVNCTVLRDGIEVELQAVPTAPLDGEGTSRVLLWAGLVLQAPYRGVREMGPVASEVYCSCAMAGSPASFHGVPSLHFITAINDSQVDSLDDMMDAVALIADETAVKLRMVDLQGQASSFTLDVDYHYWPTNQLIRQKDAHGGSEWVLEVS